MKARYWSIIAVGVATFAILVFPSAKKKWSFLNFFETDRQTSSAPLEQHLPIRDETSAETDMNRIVIANIATVPFIEAFDLLRAAPPEVRVKWLKQLDEMPESPRKAAAISSFFKTLVQIDPRIAVQSIPGLRDSRSQALAAEAMVGAAPLSAVEEMAQMMITLPPKAFQETRTISFRDVIFDWSSIDPAAAARFIEEHPELSENCNPTLIANWAEVDLHGAKDWLEQQPKSVQTEDVINFFLSTWADGNEPNALAYAVTHANEANFQRAIGSLADNIFHRSPDDAKTFLFRLPEAARNGALNHIVSMTTGLVLGLPMEWTRPPKVIADWILTLPEECSGTSMQQLLSNWDQPNRADLINWINQLPPETRDGVVADYCSVGNFENATKIAGLGMQIRDKALRDRSLRDLMKHWLPESREDALDTLEEAALTDAERQYLVGLLPQEE